MTAAFSEDAMREHFAHCIQVLGGVTAASRRLGIDERAIRRFISGERPLGVGLVRDTAKTLAAMIAEAQAAHDEIVAMIGDTDTPSA
ncbi:MAG: hypothetical protein RIS85_2813 [Pseudomonadota bacterium]